MLVLGLAPPVLAQPISFSRVADTSTIIPGQTQHFLDFSSLYGPAYRNGTVAFTGYGSGVVQGIYGRTGASLSTIVDWTTTVPGTSSSFTNLSQPVSQDGDTCFVGSGGGRQGTYLSQGASGPASLVDTSTPVPGDTGTFRGFGSPTFRNGAAVLTGSNAPPSPSGNRGVYRASPSGVARIADLSTPAPGRLSFTGFTDASWDGSSAAFSARTSDGARSVFLADQSGFTTLAQPGTPIPGTNDSLTNASLVSYEGGTYAFRGATTQTIDGVYTNLGGSFRRVVDTSTGLPGNFPFQNVLDVSVSDGVLVFFTVGGLNDWGIWSLDSEGNPFKIVGVGSVIEGRTVTQLQ